MPFSSSWCVGSGCGEGKGQRGLATPTPSLPREPRLCVGATTQTRERPSDDGLIQQLVFLHEMDLPEHVLWGLVAVQRLCPQPWCCRSPQ